MFLAIKTSIKTMDGKSHKLTSVSGDLFTMDRRMTKQVITRGHHDVDELPQH